jgi:hypothetical protein
VRPRAELLVATAEGYGKRSSLEEYPVQGRGGVGVLTVDAEKLKDTGLVAAACVAMPQEDVLLLSAAGTAARLRADAFPVLPRASWGRLVSKSRRGALLQLAAGDVLLALLCLGASGPAPLPAQEKPRRSHKPEPAADAVQPVPGAMPERKAEEQAKGRKRTATPAPATPDEPPQAPARGQRGEGSPAPRRSKPAAKPEPAADTPQPVTGAMPQRQVEERAKGRKRSAAPAPAPPAEPPQAPAPGQKGEGSPASRRSKPAAKPEPGGARESGDVADKAPPDAGPAPKRGHPAEPEATSRREGAAPVPPRQPEPATPEPEPQAVPMRARRGTVAKPPQRNRKGSNT